MFIMYISLLLAVTAFSYFAFYRGLIYLRYFQQEEYDAKRFFRWIKLNQAFDKRASMCAVLSYGALLFFASPHVSLILATVLYILLGSSIKDPRKAGKIKLHMTARATRIFAVACVLFISCIAIAFFLQLTLQCPYIYTFLIFAVLAAQALPIFIVGANMLLSPFEKRTKAKYLAEAKSILKEVNPYIIGITGSYGKTSVKAALGEVLNSALAPTFYPPRSINTVMGITREIRERMTSRHKYAVIEMGAYNVGSIKRLCDFTPPHAAIVTVIGIAHLERFGSQERVYQAKSELPQAVPANGILVCNGDDPGARRMATEHAKEKTYLYGLEPAEGLSVLASDVHLSLEGTHFKITWQDKHYAGFTKLLGQTALSNLLAVFTMACALGGDPELVLASIRTLEPVDNRLALSKEGAVHFIRDAYNSNPAGFKAALDILQQLPAKRKILMTPGMIELGAEQFEQNKEVAGLAAPICDFVVLVGDTNVKALQDGLIEAGFDQSHIYHCSSRAEAFEQLNSMLEPDDLILIENDLPDLYEVEERF